MRYKEMSNLSSKILKFVGKVDRVNVELKKEDEENIMGYMRTILAILDINLEDNNY